jgi:pyridoxine kinase
MAAHLVPRATLAMPNRFELELLSGRPCRDLAATVEAAEALRAMGPAVVVVTSVDGPDGPEPRAARCLVADGTGVWVVAAPRLGFARPPNGAGDLLAALMLHHWLLDGRPQVALSRAVSALHPVLEETLRRPGPDLALLAARDRLVAPEQVWGPIRL